MATISSDFIDPPIDPATDPTNGNWDDSGGGPSLPMPSDATAAAGIAAGLDDTTTHANATDSVVGTPTPSGPSLPTPGGFQDFIVDARGGRTPNPETVTTSPAPGGQMSATVADGTYADPKFPTVNSAGTITDPGTGWGAGTQTYSARADGAQPPGGFTPSGLPTPGAPQGPNTQGYNQPLLGGTPVGPQSGGAPGAGGLPAEYQNDPWARAFYAKEGYFNPEFNTAASITQELLRGGSANWKQANELRGVNANVDAIVDAINQRGAANYFNSANAQQWGAAHNNQITTDVNNGVYGHNQAAIGNVLNQRVAPIANPIDQSHAELTNAMQQTLTDSLKTLGATGVHQGFDNYGDATIDYFNKSGQPESIKATFVDLANAIDTLRQRSAAQAPQTPPGGGGGYGGGNGYQPRGASGPRGGYAPPGGGGPPGGPPGGNPRPAPEVFPDGRPVPASEGGYPTAVQSAYAFSPAITPGGFSPYDEPKPGITNYGDTNMQPNPGTAGFGPFPPGSAGNPGQVNGSNPEQRYATPDGYVGPVEQAPHIPVELVGQPPEVIAEMRRRGIIP